MVHRTILMIEWFCENVNESIIASIDMVCVGNRQNATQCSGIFYVHDFVSLQRWYTHKYVVGSVDRVSA